MLVEFVLKGRLLSAIYTVLLFLLLVCPSCNGRKHRLCSPSSCGNIHNITYPFRLDTDPRGCGHDKYVLSCENNSTVLYLKNSAKYYVQEINYVELTIRVVDAGVHKDDCSSVPRVPLSYSNFSWRDRDPYLPYDYVFTAFFIRCANPVNSPTYLDRSASCTNASSAVNSSYDPFLSPPGPHLYAIVSDYSVHFRSVSDLMDMCTIEMMALLSPKDNINVSFLEIHRELTNGFELTWYHESYPRYFRIFSDCYFQSDDFLCSLGNVPPVTGGLPIYLPRAFISIPLSLLGLLQVTKFLCGAPCAFGFVIYKWRRRHLSAHDPIEEFLQSQNNFMPIRYSYSDIKKMTRNFKDKLGEGGFGSVFKGKLRSGHFAAIKLLGKSNANGQEFINEVATIGRIHHTNVVQLIGFCVEGSKRALVYEFMPNGSLNNYIFPGKESVSLSWEMLYRISLGVARGIEYLHRGCDMQILHFDIKPHNILLDQNFFPKVSDFGLAKLYPRNDSIGSLTAARGTIGYIAPELFYKNIGKVSHKVDVYSFGMLLLEMAGKRKNLHASAQNSSQIYFPFWVYDQLFNGKSIGNEDATEEESKIAEKMIVVGLCCIQMKPTDRPPMNKVVEMLEGELESLELPRKPILYPDEMPMKDGVADRDQPSSSASSEVYLVKSINSTVTC